MTNAVQRLWQALAAGEPERAAAELHRRVVVERPVSGERATGAAAYLAPFADARVRVLRTVSEGRHVAVDARVGDHAVAGFYTLHDGRVLHATEHWAALDG